MTGRRSISDIHLTKDGKHQFPPRGRGRQSKWDSHQAEAPLPEIKIPTICEEDTTMTETKAPKRPTPTCEHVWKGGKCIHCLAPEHPIISDTAELIAKDHQLHACRYYVHKLRCKAYADQVAAGVLTVEQARHYYALAMINFDELMKSSGSGSVTEADQADMDLGFPL